MEVAGVEVDSGAKKPRFNSLSRRPIYYFKRLHNCVPSVHTVANPSRIYKLESRARISRNNYFQERAAVPPGGEKGRRSRPTRTGRKNPDRRQLARLIKFRACGSAAAISQLHRGGNREAARGLSRIGETVILIKAKIAALIACKARGSAGKVAARAPIRRRAIFRSGPIDASRMKSYPSRPGDISER